jgi:hypothetical protein
MPVEFRIATPTRITNNRRTDRELLQLLIRKVDNLSNMRNRDSILLNNNSTILNNFVMLTKPPITITFRYKTKDTINMDPVLSEDKSKVYDIKVVHKDDGDLIKYDTLSNGVHLSSPMVVTLKGWDYKKNYIYQVQARSTDGTVNFFSDWVQYTG